MLKDHKVKRDVYKGKIGRLRYSTEEVITTGDWVGVRLTCDDVVSGKLKIKSIGTIFSETGSFDLYIYNNLNELEQIVTLDTQANTHKINDITDIELDLHSDYTENLEYFLIYQKNGLTPKKTYNNDDDFINVNRAKKTKTNKQYGWNQWCCVDGFKKTDISDLSDVSTSTSDKMYGLTFDVEFTCNVEDVWCKDSLDFVSSNVSRAMALAIRFKAGELFFYDSMLSGNVNFERLVNSENMQNAQEFFSQEYDKIMEFIVEEIDVDTTDCFTCRDRIPMFKSHIRT
jgi:hypothetical protein